MLIIFLLSFPAQINEPPQYITVKSINKHTALISYPDGKQIKIIISKEERIIKSEDNK